jgi:hypothetical protein
MKRYLLGLALTGLAARLAKRARGIVPQHKRASMPIGVAGVLIGAGVGVGLARLLNKKS